MRRRCPPPVVLRRSKELKNGKYKIVSSLPKKARGTNGRVGVRNA